MPKKQTVALCRILELAKAHRDMAGSGVEKMWWSDVARLAYDALGSPNQLFVQQVLASASADERGESGRTKGGGDAARKTGR
jgi:hypothetical protein